MHFCFATGRWCKDNRWKGELSRAAQCSKASTSRGCGGFCPALPVARSTEASSLKRVISPASAGSTEEHSAELPSPAAASRGVKRNLPPCLPGCESPLCPILRPPSSSRLRFASRGSHGRSSRPPPARPRESSGSGDPVCSTEARLVRRARPKGREGRSGCSWPFFFRRPCALG